MEFAQRLKQVMADKSITMYRLAKELGVHQTTIKNWLDGKGEPRISEASNLATALEIPIDYLLNGTYEVNSCHLALGVHIYRNTSLFGIDSSVLDELPQNSYDIKYQDKYTIIAVNKDSGISDNDLNEIIDECKYSTITFGSELEKIFESESRRLSIPVKTLKMEFLKRKNDGSNLILNHENISFYFDSIYGQNRKPENRVLSALNKLNLSGQQKAVERVEELTEIPRYRAETAPQDTPEPQEGTDTTPPLESSEGTQKLPKDKK